MAHKTLKIIVKGRVQGVGFRWFTRELAQSVGVKGTVRNLVNGDVEVVAQADIHALDYFLSKLKEGPRFGSVEQVEVTELPDAQLFSSFDVTF